MKWLFNILGGLALALAIIGIFLPLLPTTPFLLLASACFLRGSPRMHDWMLHNRLFGAQLRHYQTHRGIPLRTKYVAIALTWISLLVSMSVLGKPALQALLGAIGLGVTIFILRMRTVPALDLKAEHRKKQ